MAKGLLEKVIHKKLRDWAYKEYGEYDQRTGTGLVKVVKLTTLAMYGEAGIPDHLWLVKGGRSFFLELKREDETSTAIQSERQDQLRGMGFDVAEASGLEMAKVKLALMVERALGKGRRAPC